MSRLGSAPLLLRRLRDRVAELARGMGGRQMFLETFAAAFRFLHRRVVGHRTTGAWACAAIVEHLGQTVHTASAIVRGVKSCPVANRTGTPNRAVHTSQIVCASTT